MKKLFCLRMVAPILHASRARTCATVQFNFLPQRGNGSYLHLSLHCRLLRKRSLSCPMVTYPLPKRHTLRFEPMNSIFCSFQSRYLFLKLCMQLFRQLAGLARALIRSFHGARHSSEPRGALERTFSNFSRPLLRLLLRYGCYGLAILECVASCTALKREFVSELTKAGFPLENVLFLPPARWRRSLCEHACAFCDLASPPQLCAAFSA